MKRRIRQRPNRHFIHATDHLLQKQLARHTIQLQRISRFVRLIRAWNSKLVHATDALVRSIARDNEREIARLTERKDLAELHARYHLLTPREREVMALGTAEITVKIQRASVMKKMEAKSIADLVRMGEKLEILSDA